MKAQPHSEGQDARSASLAAGIDTVFNLDVLRHTHESKADNLLVSHLGAIVDENKSLIYEFIAILFVQYVKALNRHRGAIFSQGSHSQPGAVLEHIRQSAMNFFTLLWALVVDGSGGGGQYEKSAWQTRLALLRTVDQENLFSQKQAGSQVTMDEILELVLSGLNDGWKGKRAICLLSIKITDISPCKRTFGTHRCLHPVPLDDYSH
jgi:hypothetical protein